jgi:transcriptional regulator with XRE-family HTH domain
LEVFRPNQTKYIANRSIFRNISEMQLKTFLKQNSMSLARLARQCGVSPTTIMRVRDGQVIPSRRTLEAIVSATGGAVTVVDMISIASLAPTEPSHQNFPNGDIE